MKEYRTRRARRCWFRYWTFKIVCTIDCKEGSGSFTDEHGVLYSWFWIEETITIPVRASLVLETMTVPVRISLLLEIKTQFKVYKEKFSLSGRSIECLAHRILSSHHQSMALLYLHMVVLRDHLECRHYLYVCLTPLLKCQILMIRAFLYFIFLYILNF